MCNTSMLEIFRVKPSLNYLFPKYNPKVIFTRISYKYVAIIVGMDSPELPSNFQSCLQALAIP